MTASDPHVLDPDALARRAGVAAAARHPGATIDGLRRLPGGLSSLTFAARLSHDGGTVDVVLKVAPPGLPPVHNRDVLRQARLLDAVGGLAGFPVPRVLLRDAGDPPEVPPLFGMELVPGEAYEPLLDVADVPPLPEVAGERMRVAARALAALHTATPSALGLDDVGETGPAEEVDRWVRLLRTVDPDIGPGRDDLARRLLERVPAGRPARVHHGDYRVANMLFVGTGLRAVIDWEIWSLGDPRWDLAWLMMHAAPEYAFHHERPAADRAAGSQVPDAAAIVREYLVARDGTDVSAADTSDLDWFVAAGLYKGVSTIAALYKRERLRPEPEPTLVTAAGHLDALLHAGHEALDRWVGRT